MLYVLDAKPLSVNRAWQGRRFKSLEYKVYERRIAALLQQCGVKKVEGRVQITYRFCLKNYALTDADNLVKPLQDILVKMGAIDDDRFIDRYVIEKCKTDGDGQIIIEIESLL